MRWWLWRRMPGESFDERCGEAIDAGGEGSKAKKMGRIRRDAHEGTVEEAGTKKVIDGWAGAEAEDGRVGLRTWEPLAEAAITGLEGVKQGAKESINRLTASSQLTKKASTRGELKL